jgi:hypothetical protein
MNILRGGLGNLKEGLLAGLSGFGFRKLGYFLRTIGL